SFEDKLERLWRVDVQGTIATCRAVGERMLTRGNGTIITLGWDQAETGMEGDAGQMFGATKGAVMAFTKALAKTLAPAVRVNGVAPGWVRTKWGGDAPAAWRGRATGEALLRRWGEPADVAAAAVFLASPAASFITGQIINVNGGFAGPRPFE
ncbi:MAG: SDR family oxidoreductase, partial [Planctomycetota bacterium]